MAARYRSNEDDTRSISKSIFLTNFPDSTTSNDLWKLFQGYGSVVDVYIPNRTSKAGKHFAFVRFIRVDNIDRLVGNLCTLCSGRMHLNANVVRFERTTTKPSRSTFPAKPNNFGTSSFATVLKGNNAPPMLTRDVNNNVGEFIEVRDFRNPSEIQGDSVIKKYLKKSGPQDRSNGGLTHDTEALTRFVPQMYRMLANNLKVLPMLNAPDQTSDPRKGGDCQSR
ncbi:RNA-directed DNA polymerase, eukaryota, nucleotide-binding alpha-beta plait domain protein [Tanacetum coccineum]